MEVILKKDVENLGFADDLVEVKNGYGRNFLIPQGLAVLATNSAKKVLAETMRQRAHRDAKLIKDAQKVAKTLEDVSFKIMSKSADGDKLFGSVNNGDVSEALEKLGHAIDKKFISIDGRNIKRVGDYVAHIRLHRELIVDVPFNVYADPASLTKKKKAAPKEEVVVAADEDDYEKTAKENIDDVLGMASKKTVEEPVIEEEAPKSVEGEAPKSVDVETPENKEDKE